MIDVVRLGPDPYDPNGYEKQREASTPLPDPHFYHFGVDFSLELDEYKELRNPCREFGPDSDNFIDQSSERLIDPHVPGAKLDHNKPRASLVLKDFSLALMEVCKVGTKGADKYSDHGWLSVENGIERYESALLRHLLDMRETDEESGLLHAAHAAWNALAVLELKLRGK